VQHALANRTHYAIAALQHMGHAPTLITQNVDRLHHQAAATDAERERILELHGSLKHTRCLACGHTASRDHVQGQLSALNPAWAAYADEVAREGRKPSTNPDGQRPALFSACPADHPAGDVDLQGRSYETFEYPACDECGDGPIKPAVCARG
jgi:hypothetical protein